MKIEDVNMDEWYFCGGSKTVSGKGRIVPIHERIRPFVSARVATGNEYLFGARIPQSTYRKYWHDVMDKIGADKTRTKHGTPLRPGWMMQKRTGSALI